MCQCLEIRNDWRPRKLSGEPKEGIPLLTISYDARKVAREHSQCDVLEVVEVSELRNVLPNEVIDVKAFLEQER